MGVLLAAALSVLIALNIPNKYRSEALLTPRTSGGAAGGLVGQMASQVGGLASLAGIELGGLGEKGIVTTALEILQSRYFFEKYLYDEILIEMMAVESWDEATGRLILDPSLYEEAKNTWVREAADARLKAKPSVQEAYIHFASEYLNVSQDRNTAFITVSITHLSPIVAKKWVERMVNGINEEVRARDLEEAQKSVEFLRQQRKETNIVSLSEVFAELIEQQTKTMMLANASKEYVFQVIEPPVAPEFKSEPQRAIICILGTFFGFMTSIIFVLLNFFLSRNKAYEANG